MSAHRGRKFARKALERVKAHATVKGEYVPSAYASRVNRVPLWIREHGLAQTLAFLADKAKDNATYGMLLEDFEAVLGKGKQTNLLQHVLYAEPPALYHLLARDALMVAHWMKRWCSVYEEPKPAPKAAVAPKQDEEHAS